MFDQYIMDVSDFTFVRRLSAGAFAKVFLARRKDTGQYCAIKVGSQQGMIMTEQSERKGVMRS